MSRRDDIEDYLDWCSRLTPEQKLKKMGEMRAFFYKYMTPEGRAFLLETRGIDTSSFQVKQPRKTRATKKYNSRKSSKNR